MNRISKMACLALALFTIRILPASAVEKGYTVFHGDRDTPRVALTVDDCYNGEHVAEIIALCEEHQVPVTFFIIGSALKSADSQVWLSALDAGCEIGNHTWSHAVLPNLNSRDIKRQLSRTQERLDEVLGFHYPMQVMRPPYGKLSTDPNKMSDIPVVEAIEAAGYAHAVRWDVSQTDAAKALKDTQNGSILLYHANPKDIRCLTKLIPALLAEGYECVTVSELLGLPPVPDARDALRPEDWLVVEEVVDESE